MIFLYRSIHYDLREPDVMALFSAFGKVVSCDMTMDAATGRSKGFCFLEYDNSQSADAAMAMNGFELAGRKVIFIAYFSYFIIFHIKHHIIILCQIKVGRPFQGAGAAALASVSSLSNPLGLPVNPLQTAYAAQLGAGQPQVVYHHMCYHSISLSSISLLCLHVMSLYVY